MNEFLLFWFYGSGFVNYDQAGTRRNLPSILVLQGVCEIFLDPLKWYYNFIDVILFLTQSEVTEAILHDLLIGRLGQARSHTNAKFDMHSLVIIIGMLIKAS